MAKYCKGVNEETTTGVKEMSAKGELLFPVINVTVCVTKSKKSKFDNVWLPSLAQRRISLARG